MIHLVFFFFFLDLYKAQATQHSICLKLDIFFSKSRTVWTHNASGQTVDANSQYLTVIYDLCNKHIFAVPNKKNPTLKTALPVIALMT